MSDPDTIDAAVSAGAPMPVLGNGKIALTPSLRKRFGTDTCMIASDFPVRNGSYASNLVPGFHVNEVHFFTSDPDLVEDPKYTYSATRARLNMQSGIFTTSYDVSNASGDVLAAVEVDLYAVRTLPYCIMQSFRVTFTEALTSDDELCFYHHMYADTQRIASPTYAMALVHDARPGGSGSGTPADTAVPVFTAAGRYGESPVTYTNAEAKQPTIIAAASAYLFEDPALYQVMGANTYVNNSARGFTKVRVLGDDPSAVQYRFHIVSAMMTNADFQDAIEEVKRIVVNVRAKGATAAATATRVRADHVRAWNSLWTSDVHIDLKTGITQQDRDRALRHQRALRYALYSTYACTREGVNADINPMNLHVTDNDGSMLTDGDLWLVPMLILIKPDIARTMLEYKHKTVNAAMQLAASYGFRGTKYPYHSDVIGYRSALYWDSVSPLFVFNTAVIAINVWNYYRVTTDKEWMLSKGYTILKNCADFIASVVVPDDSVAPGPMQQRQYMFNDVVGIGGVAGDNNAFTVYTAKLALRYALEASYDLQLPPRDAWTDVYFGLKVPFFTNQLGDVIMLNDGYPTTPPPLLEDRAKIMEPLLLLLPYYNALLFGVDTRVTSSTISKNLEFYRAHLPVEFAQHPYNLLLESAMLAQLAQTDETHIDAFYDKVDEFLNVCTDDYWGSFIGFPGTPSAGHDTMIAATFLLVVLQSLGGLRIAGGVTETRFLYEDMKIRIVRCGIMPRAWRQLRIDGVGKTKQTALVTNKLFYE